MCEIAGLGLALLFLVDDENKCELLDKENSKERTCVNCRIIKLNNHMDEHLKLEFLHFGDYQIRGFRVKVYLSVCS